MSPKALESKDEKIIQRSASSGLKILDQPGFKTEEIRVPFLDNLRYLMILLVLVYHACGAYTSVAPHWLVHDSTSLAADFIRELFDVFMMPLLFFIAGFFAPLSLEKKGTFEFLKDKVW